MARGVRLWILLARDARQAVIFRRGPSKRVQLIVWKTDTDTFIPGQWLKGRIYERRADLSPSGQRLIYFAAKFKGPFYSWTAASRPPYLTALALWPKTDTWGGGGIFASENEILLDHSDLEPADGFVIPESIQVRPLDLDIQGEDKVLARRLIRDGWIRQQVGKLHSYSLRARIMFRYDPPEVWSREHPAGRPWSLRRTILGHGEQGGAWDVYEHTVVEHRGGTEIQLGRTDWADWDHSGFLAFAKHGQLFRVRFDSSGNLNPVETAESLIDTSLFVFTEIVAPPEAKDWWAELPDEAGQPIPGR